MASKHVVRLGPLKIGGGNPVMVQSMTNTDTRDVEATLGQIGRLVERGCEAVRVAVPDDRAADVLRELHDKSPVPLIADIHFDWRLAVRAIEAGFEGLRINPGNIGDESRVERVVRAAKANGAAIRVGVNSGSVEKELLEKWRQVGIRNVIYHSVNPGFAWNEKDTETVKLLCGSGFDVSVTGKLTAEKLQNFKGLPIYSFIVGTAIAKSGNPLKAIREFKQSIHDNF